MNRINLDNAANIFPAVASRHVTHVFRITAVMREKIYPLILQEALEDTLPFFPAFAVQLIRGKFRYYFEENKGIPKVYQEEQPPCSYIAPEENSQFLFRMVYFEKRIHLEVFHVLTDGNGAAYFLKAVCYRYCQLAFPECFPDEERNHRYGLEQAGLIEDGYMACYSKRNPRTFQEKRAVKIKGKSRKEDAPEILTTLIPVDELKKLCKNYGVSITEYITAIVLDSIYQEIKTKKKRKRAINIFIPVNLRTIFKTETMRNFFSNILVSCPAEREYLGFEDILKEVQDQFAKKKKKTMFEERISYTVGGEKQRIARIAPLIAKELILRRMYNLAKQNTTLSFSNLGVIEIQENFKQWIEGFRFLLDTSPEEPVRITGCSYNGMLALTVTSQIYGNHMGSSLVQHLTSEGIPVTLEMNLENEDIDCMEQARERVQYDCGSYRYFGILDFLLH